jgi:DnaJ-class molecular chaperone
MTTKFDDSLAILGLNQNATIEDIKLVYRKLAKIYHPDLKKKDPTNYEDFLKIQKAYDYLIQNFTKIPVQEKNSIQNFSSKANLSQEFNTLFQDFEDLIQSFRSDFSRTSVDFPEPFVDLKKILKERDKREGIFF